MESNWRWNVEDLGLSEAIWWPMHQPAVIQLTMTRIAELNPHIVVGGNTWTHLAQWRVDKTFSYFDWVRLLTPWEWVNFGAWLPSTGHFPLWFTVLPD